MKKIKVYIVTWQRNDVLEQLLNNLFNESDFKDYENTEVNIINNHSNFFINNEFVDKVNVYDNMTRVDWSTGNLAQDFNFALVHGFKDLQNPDSEIVVTLQNDTVLHPQWTSCLLEQMERYDFFVGYLGDNVVGYKPEHIKKVGLWDENYCTVYHKEADYYLRSLIYNKENVALNDILHRRLHNYNPNLTLDLIGERGFVINENWTARITESEEHQKLRDEQNLCNPATDYYWKWKWAGTKDDLPLEKGSWEKPGWLINWPTDFTDNLPNPPKVPQFIKYPFFEKDVENLVEKGFVTDGRLIK
tara:strand:- start:5855 stop:6763 length:909 start_codon:yes stop_codon:yes gene_type:complete